MLARFFIDRPIFAWVISIVIVLIGGVAAATLPIAQYPEITPPTVSVTCQYPGASAQVVADTVAAPIEQQVNGVENMMYMSSQCTNDGSYSLTVTFKLGTDVNMAQVLVQNRVTQATPLLPDVVKQIGVTVKKRSPSILLVVNLYSEDDPRTNKPYFDQLYLSNYATIQLKDELARLDGVGDITVLGQQDYSMRVWIDPEKLASRNLTATDVVRVLQEQNVQVAAGQVGQQPVPRGQDFQYTITTLGRLETPEQFDGIILKTGQNAPVAALAAAANAPAASKTGEAGAVTYLRDVSYVELGPRNQDVRSRLDGKPSIGLAVFQLPGSNALDTGDRIRARMVELEKRFPPGLKYAIVYDTTPFVRESVKEVLKTLRDAVLLVALVVLVFLQDWKALILPLIDVAVSLIGTFAVLAVMGFSLNNLTLFGLVLAIGIVVDDAIVVLENIERWLAKGLPVREATIHAMDEITGPIIAITLVLSSVFIPSAFLGGITGQFFRQFALTIAAAMIISAINTMTMTPARAASIFRTEQHGGAGGHEQLKEALPWWSFGILGAYLSYRFALRWLAPSLGVPFDEEGDPAPSWLVWTEFVAAGALAGGLFGWFLIKPVNRGLGVAFNGFNKVFDAATTAYGRTVAWGLRLFVIVLVLYVGLLGLTGLGFVSLPTGFIPPQDKGYLVVNVELPDSSSLERTQETCDAIEDIAHNERIVVDSVAGRTQGRQVSREEREATWAELRQRARAEGLFEDPIHEEIYRKEPRPGVAHSVSIPGMSFVLGAAVSSNYGSLFLVLEPFHQRHGKGLSADEIAVKVRADCARYLIGARVGIYGAPAVEGLGNAGGFKLMIQDRGGGTLPELQKQADAVAAKANQRPGILAFDSLRTGTPQFYVDIDRVKCKTLGVPLNDVFQTLQVFLGGFYVNDFNRFGRTWQVNVQADARFRIDPDIIKQLKVRNEQGDMLPLGAVLTVVPNIGPVMVTRYNMFPSATITGVSLPGVSTGTTINEMEVSADTLPRTMSYEWTELTYLQKESTRIDSLKALLQNPLMAFAGAVVLVFLVLAAQYESWGLPLSVILVVPMCLLAALTGIALAHMDVNIFVQIGFVVLVGLACKNAILVVEFARDRQKEGMTAFDAAVEASKTRLRPIVMTSFAFILGVFPLVIATGAGAEMRRPLGTAVCAGMLGVTAFGLLLTPVFYYTIRRGASVPKTPVPTVPVPAADGEPLATATPEGEGKDRVQLPLQP